MQLSIHSIEGIAFNGALNTDVVSFYSGLDTLELDSQDHLAISVTESNHILSCMHCLHLNQTTAWLLCSTIVQILVCLCPWMILLFAPLQSIDVWCLPIHP